MTTLLENAPGWVPSLPQTMKALVYQGPGKSAILERPVPRPIAPTDAIVKVRKTTICGTDLHILKGDVPTCEPGRILGHEGIGIVEEVGAGVTAFHAGDRVLISCISACGKCEYCRAECIRIVRPAAGFSATNRRHASGICAHPARRYEPLSDSRGADEEALVMLSDILPTGFECGVLNGKVQPGGTIAIVGAGPIGLAAC